jgi:LPS-assembly protein
VERSAKTSPEAGAHALPNESPTASHSFAGALDAGIDWHSCRVVDQPHTAGAAAVDDRLISISADAAVIELEPEIAYFSGEVQMIQGSLELLAAELSLDRKRDIADATGDVLLSNDEIRIAGSSATYRPGPGTGEIAQASYRLPERRARGDANHAELLADGRTRYKDITYTTCSPQDEDWLLRAKSLEIDTDEGLATAKHATLRFFGVPFLYTPTFTFPTDDRRRSGFLPPTFGTTESSGTDISIPYYLNLAPNYDLTLVPRVMSKRGAMLGGEFRFLTRQSKGDLRAEFLPNDNEYEGNNSARGAASLRATTVFNSRTIGALRLNYASDDDYLRDLGKSIAVTSATNLERAGDLRYSADHWDFFGRLQYYQTIDDSLRSDQRPYSRLPQLRVNLEQPDAPAGTTLHLDAEYVNFHRSNSLHGHRIDLFPAISLPMRDQWRYIEPKIGARYTGYLLSDVEEGDDDSPDELSGLFSIDSGLFFDRTTDYFGTGATQTLEPRLYYLKVDSGDQDDQPIFDTALLPFGFSNLFRENRFSGSDRFGDTNQLTLALTSRMLSEETGAELLRASIGQIVYFEDREVTLPDEPEEDDNSSALVTEVEALIGSGWRSLAGLQWDPHDGSKGNIDQGVAQLVYRDSVRDRVLSLAYRYRDGLTDQTDIAAVWPVNEKVSLIGRHYYSLRDERLLEAIAGLEYGSCCWRIRAVARQFANSTTDELDLGFLLQLELTGLGKFGTNIESTLERAIYGYR